LAGFDQRTCYAVRSKRYSATMHARRVPFAVEMIEHQPEQLVMKTDNKPRGTDERTMGSCPTSGFCNGMASTSCTRSRSLPGTRENTVSDL